MSLKISDSNFKTKVLINGNSFEKHVTCNYHADYAKGHTFKHIFQYICLKKKEKTSLELHDQYLLSKSPIELQTKF